MRSDTGPTPRVFPLPESDYEHDELYRNSVTASTSVTGREEVARP